MLTPNAGGQTSAGVRLPARSRLAAGVAVVCAVLFGLLTVDLFLDGPVSAYDEHLAQVIHAYAVAHPGPLVDLARLGGFLGLEAIVVLTVFLGLYWLLGRQWREFTMLVLGTGGGEVLFQVLSNAIGRHRPFFPDPLEVLTVPGFPSGHTISSVALFGLIYYVGAPLLPSRGWRIAALIITIVINLWVGISRVYLGAHFPLDVISGYLVGIAWVVLVYPAVDRRYALRWARQHGRAEPG